MQLSNRGRSPPRSRIRAAAPSRRTRSEISRSGSTIARQGNTNDQSNISVQQDGNSSKSDSVNSPAVNQADETGSNIKVVVRCRERNKKEIELKSPVVIKTSPSAPTDVHVSTAEDVRTNSDSKIYNVDHVFGPESDQSMVYDEVVSPMVKDVLAGMTCTVFAYGQTGTGKTYVLVDFFSLNLF